MASSLLMIILRGMAARELFMIISPKMPGLKGLIHVQEYALSGRKMLNNAMFYAPILHGQAPVLNLHSALGLRLSASVKEVAEVE